jgi:glycosyltransferase involved in cell wall biosynthesis
MVLPIVSVIIPVYNRSALLRRAVQSVLMEHSIKTEVIVVDDGSTDDSAAVGMSFGSSVRVISQRNAGSSAARNRGLAEARGKYVRTLDSDDWLLPEVTSAQVEKLELTGADVCYGDWRDAFDGGDRFQTDELCSLGVMNDPVATLLTSKWCPPFCYLLRRDVVEKNGGWPSDISLKYTEDLAFILSMALNGCTFVHLPIDVGRYYHHSGPRDSRGNLLGWCDAARKIYLDAIAKLDATSSWTGARQEAMGGALLRLSKVYFGIDRQRFRHCIEVLRRVAPGFQPPGSLYRRFVTAFGYEAVESILEIRRAFYRRLRAGQSR